ncbi:ChaB family protein [Alteromonas sp. ASW11-19]|uniref:ChaB family protein n=1 Tax=Alteromonas salexigens TaxID=2982530 RepID=A0ABT2VLB7_9ALTE|nr:ChaB family protein [Alteromonas salexigens]MCU7554101.1 ChaB family protein [Alteromonas salexigens]
MPYSSRTSLPDSMKDNLPAHAQDIFIAAFNRAWEEYAEPKDRHGNNSREDVAFKVAWSAVKQSYHKNTNGKWVKDTD